VPTQMIDCLLLKSSAEPVKTLPSGRRILHFPEFVSSQCFEIIYQTHLLNSLRFASLLSLSTRSRFEAAILVIFNLVSSDVLHHFSLHFKTTPELLSHYPVGMARIIGSF
ncbi:hypothetical protein, partial [Rheinheimera tangshanensis]|uniref:hypothetical protein n=1 Tax=Rheinheimera tangshanensis TaxID=400153 RepID=UPI0031DBB143